MAEVSILRVSTTLGLLCQAAEIYAAVFPVLTTRSCLLLCLYQAFFFFFLRSRYPIRSLLVLAKSKIYLQMFTRGYVCEGFNRPVNINRRTQKGRF